MPAEEEKQEKNITKDTRRHQKEDRNTPE